MAELAAPFVGNYTPASSNAYMAYWTKIWIWAAAGVLLLPVVGLRTVRELAPLSFLGMMAALLVVGVVTGVSMSLANLCPEALVPTLAPNGSAAALYCHTRVPINGTSVHVEHAVVDATGLPTAFAAVTVSFGGHCVFPTIEEHMGRPDRFHAVFNAAYVLLMLMYIPVAAAGYYAFGDGTLSPILDNLPTEGTLGALNMATKAIITFHVLTAYPLLLNVVVLELEAALGLGITSAAANPAAAAAAAVTTTTTMTAENGGGRECAVLWRATLRTALVLLTAVIAYGVPYFGDVMTLVGALCLAMVVFVLPVLFNLKLRGNQIGLLERIWCVLVALTGASGAGIAAYQAVMALIADVNNK